MFSWEIYEFFRSSCRGCFMKKAVLKNFPIFIGKLKACNFIKNRLQHRCFLLNIFRTPISKNICRRLLTVVSNFFCIDSFIKVALRVEKTEVFRKDWNFADWTYFVSCIMRKHYFLLWTKEIAFFCLFLLWNYFLQRWAIWLRSQL